jgi:hypothetical protein
MIPLLGDRIAFDIAILREIAETGASPSTPCAKIKDVLSSEYARISARMLLVAWTLGDVGGRLGPVDRLFNVSCATTRSGRG